MGMNINLYDLELFTKDWFLVADLFDFLCGANISNGTYRSVYNCNFDLTLVVKIERFGDKKNEIGFNNVAEWDIWHNINGDRGNKQYSKFLAPCRRISSCSRFLLQEKTTPIEEKDLPKLIPYFLSDTKCENWGRLGKRIVCHDYANHKFYTAISKDKLIKAKWH